MLRLVIMVMPPFVVILSNESKVPKLAIQYVICRLNDIHNKEYSNQIEYTTCKL